MLASVSVLVAACVGAAPLTEFGVSQRLEDSRIPCSDLKLDKRPPSTEELAGGAYKIQFPSGATIVCQAAGGPFAVDVWDTDDGAPDGLKALCVRDLALDGHLPVRQPDWTLLPSQWNVAVGENWIAAVDKDSLVDLDSLASSLGGKVSTFAEACTPYQQDQAALRQAFDDSGAASDAAEASAAAAASASAVVASASAVASEQAAADAQAEADRAQASEVATAVAECDVDTARNGYTGTAALAELAKCDDPETRSAVATNGVTSDETLAQLADDHARAVRAALATRLDLPEDVALRLLNDEDARVQMLLLSHYPYTSKDYRPVLTKLAASGDASIRQGASEFARNPLNLLRPLVRDPDKAVASATQRILLHECGYSELQWIKTYCAATIRELNN